MPSRAPNLGAYLKHRTIFVDSSSGEVASARRIYFQQKPIQMLTRVQNGDQVDEILSFPRFDQLEQPSHVGQNLCAGSHHDEDRTSKTSRNSASTLPDLTVLKEAGLNVTVAGVKRAQ